MHHYTERHIVPHGCYLVNLANGSKKLRKVALDGFLDDICRCESIGVRLFNFHPGMAGVRRIPMCSAYPQRTAVPTMSVYALRLSNTSCLYVFPTGSFTAPTTRMQAIKWVAEGVNEAHRVTKNVVCLRGVWIIFDSYFLVTHISVSFLRSQFNSVALLSAYGYAPMYTILLFLYQVCLLENMAGQGNTLGRMWEDLRDIIEHVDDKYEHHLARLLLRQVVRVF